MKNMTIPSLILLILATAFPLAGCTSKPIDSEVPPTALTQLTVEVFYREKIALPPGAVLKVRLEDVSKMDVASVEIASRMVPLETAPPYSVDLSYDPTVIKEGMRYGIRARIEFDGKLLFINDTHIDPFAGPADEPVKALVVSVKR